MIVPTSRLMWIFGLIACPALTLAGIEPEQRSLGLAAAGSVLVLAVLDALLGRNLLGPLVAELPAIARIVKGREGILPLRLQHEGCRISTVRLALALPAGFQSSKPELVTGLPDAPASRYSWPVTAPERGHFPITTCHAETPSPMGLWLHRRALPVRCDVRVQPDLASALQVLVIDT